MYTMGVMLGLPSSLVTQELEGLYGARVLQDMGEIIRYYEIYDKGASFIPDSNNKDYKPADLRYKTIRGLIDKEARFLFSKSPDVWIDVPYGDTKESRIEAKMASTVYQTLVDNVFEENRVKSKLFKAAKDCFIGKRIAVFLNFNPVTGIQLSFIPSLEFVYDVEPSDTDKLSKIVVFYGMNDEKAQSDQRIYKKKYWMENGFCHYSEAIYDGLGRPIEVVAEDEKTRLTFIPAWVIVNDGLTGDLIGVSEVQLLEDYEAWYSRLASADIDSERTGMSPIRYTIDASTGSTSDLSVSPGAFWDIASDQNSGTDRSAQVGVLETNMSYSAALSSTLDRVKAAMYEQTAVPNVSPEAMKGVVTSGKTLQAIYWDLIVRCDEKMLVWRPVLIEVVKAIIEGCRLYPEVFRLYLDDTLPDIEYSVRVENQYPIPEDEAEEKASDMVEVSNQVMSRKSYLKKWRNLTEDEADEELKQIALEKSLFEESYPLPPVDASDLGEVLLRR